MDFSIIKSQLWKEHLDEVQKLATCPTLLPEYQKEWLSFVHKRTVMISKLGGNSETYDFKSEFDDIWRSKFNRIMNDKFEKKVKLGQKIFYDGSYPKIISVIISKVYHEIAKPYRSVSPASSDSSSRSGLYRSNSSRRHKSFYKSASACTSHKRHSPASRRSSSSSDVSVTSESMKNSPNIRSQSTKDRSYYKISTESKCVYQSKSGSTDRFGSIKNNSSYSRSRSRSTSKKKIVKKEHKRRRSKYKAYLNDHLEVKKYKDNNRRSSSSSRSKSTSFSHCEPKYHFDDHNSIQYKHSCLNSFSEHSDSFTSTDSSSSSINSRRGRHSQPLSTSSKNIKPKRKYSRSQFHKRYISKSPLHYTKDAGRYVESLPNLKASGFSSSGIINRTQPKQLKKLTNTSNADSTKATSLELYKDEIKEFLQTFSDLKDEPSPGVEQDQLSPNEPFDIANTFSKHHFNKYLKYCSANIELKESDLLSHPTLSLKDEMNLFLSNALIQESIKSLKEMEPDRHVSEYPFSTNKGEDKGLHGVKKENLPKEITFSGSDNVVQIVNPVVVCIDSDDEKITEKETIKKNVENSHFSVNENLKRTTSKIKNCHIYTAATTEGIQMTGSENIFFAVYRDTLVYLKNHEELLGMYASVIGPLLLDLCSTYGSELNTDHQIALTLILDMLRLNMCTKPLSSTARQDHKEAMSKIENVLLHYSGEETDTDSYPSFLYGYDVNDLASKMFKKNSVETKKFINCLLLHDGFENVDSEPFTNLYEQVEIKKRRWTECV